MKKFEVGDRIKFDLTYPLNEKHNYHLKQYFGNDVDLSTEVFVVISAVVLEIGIQHMELKSERTGEIITNRTGKLMAKRFILVEESIQIPKVVDKHAWCLYDVITKEIIDIKKTRSQARAIRDRRLISGANIRVKKITFTI